MADIISLQELADAKLDAQSLEQFINGGVDEEVLTRLSQQYPTIKKLLLEHQKYNGRAYKTYAEMDADKANLSSKTKVTVTNDAIDSNNGDWQWDGSVFTKSAYDPLTQAKNYSFQLYLQEDRALGFKSDYLMQKGGQALNGATLNNYKVSIPAGATGFDSYVQDYIDLGDTTSIAGKKITIIAQISTSSNLLSVMPFIRNQVSANINGVISTNVAVVDSTALNQIDATTIRVSADYIIAGALSEKVALGFQVMNHGGNTTTTLREFQVKETGIRFEDASVYSEISKTRTELNANITTVSNELANSSSVQVSEYKQSGQGQNGAVRTGDRIDIPVGQTGLNSYLRFVTPILNLESLNFKARLTAVLKTSDDYFSKFGNTNIRLAKYANYSDGSPIESNAATSFKLNRIDKNTYEMYVDFDSTAGRKAYALWFQHTNTSDSSTARFVELKALYLNVLSADNPIKISALTKTYQVETLKQRVTYLEAAISSLTNPTGYSRVVTVKPTGGDYTHVKLALDAITDAAIDNKVMIAVYPGTYTEYAEWHTKDYVDIVGIGRRDEIIIKYDSGDAADYNTVRNTSLCWMASESMFKNLTLKVKNGRYVIHLESNGNKEDITCRIEICSVIHEGNATESHWWSPSQYAVGAGLSAGQKVILRGSYFAGRGGGFSWHTPNNHIAYTKACSVDAESCVFENTRTSGRNEYPYAGAFSIKPICKGAADTTRLVGNKFVNGKVYYSAGEWLDTTDTTTNRAQIEVFGHGNVGFDFYAHELSYVPNVI